jgi:hypothetical protein
MGQFYRMAEEVGFLRHKPEGGRGGKHAPPRLPGRADDPSDEAMTREVPDVARYITGMTSQLEALAITAHLDRLAYFLGMAKAESEILVRVSGVSEAKPAEDESHEPIAGPQH